MSGHPYEGFNVKDRFAKMVFNLKIEFESCKMRIVNERFTQVLREGPDLYELMYRSSVGGKPVTNAVDIKMVFSVDELFSFETSNYNPVEDEHYTDFTIGLIADDVSISIEGEIEIEFDYNWDKKDLLIGQFNEQLKRLQTENNSEWKGEFFYFDNYSEKVFKAPNFEEEQYYGEDW